MTTLDIFSHSANSLSHPALISENSILSYKDYSDLVAGTAGKLADAGISAGKKVALADVDPKWFPILFMALLQNNALAIPVDYRIPQKNLESMLRETGCDFVIASKKEITGIKFLDARDLIRAGNRKELNPLPLEQRATIIFTSGSMGEAKAVVHTLGNHYFSATGSATNIQLRANDRWLVSLPFFHIAGIAILFRTLIAGAAAVIRNAGKSLSQNITDFSVTHLSLVPAQLHDIKKEGCDTKNLKAILLGGGPLPGKLISELVGEGWPLVVSYGNTEMASQITAGWPENCGYNSAGNLLPHREITISPEGEIAVRGKTLCPGIISKNHINPVTADDGWYYTGDMGFLNDKRTLFIIGRKDNQFISGGENVHPEEIESVIAQYPGVNHCIVVAVPDEKFGARPAAFIDGGSIDPGKLKKFLSDKLTSFKIPDYFLSWPDMLKGLKPDRKQMQEIAREQLKSGK